LLKQFYSITRRFNFAEKDVLVYLFKSHCTSLFGSEHWIKRDTCKKDFDTLGVTFHKCLKRILNKRITANNHDTCEEARINTFKHFVNKKIICHATNLFKSKSPCFIPLKNYFIQSSIFRNDIIKLFFEEYQIDNVFNNDIDAVLSRIDFVEAREIRRYYIPI
jgi:hypothetical protein